MEIQESQTSLSEIHFDPKSAHTIDQLNGLLNKQPPASWVKKHPFAKGVDYIPIDKVEMLLTKIFQQWRCEVISVSQLFNSISVHVRLHYLHPVTGQWMYHDGVGAVGVQTDAGSGASNLSSIKQNAVMLALPAAKSYALKDAAELIGVIFGSNLNRKDTMAFTPSYSKPKVEKKYE